MRVAALSAIAVALVPAIAIADPDPAPAKPPDKVDAQSLVLSGVKLISAHDYLGALAVFKDAYARFPSSKILLDIGTAERLLGRNADAANTYQRYIEAPDADASKAVDAQTALADLDKLVGLLDITVTPADAEVQVGDDDWTPAASLHVARVEPGPFTVRARKTGFQTAATTATIEVGQHVPIALDLVAMPPDPATIPTPSALAAPRTEAITTDVATPPPSPLGAFAVAHVDFPHDGAAALVGVSFDGTEQLTLQAAAILGPTYGGYGGAKLTLLHGSIEPTISAGLPIFFSDGTRFGVRGAAGIDFAVMPRLSIVAEAGVEHYFNVQMGIASTLFIPAIGIAARL